MAQCKLIPQEFIKNCFTPQIAVMSTPLAEKCWEKNNLNFVELLQPFSRLQNDVNFVDPTGVNISIRNLKLTFLDVKWKPPQTTLARVLLNTSVSNASDSKAKTLQIGKYKLDIPSHTPSFESWRDIFFKVQYPSEHEFLKHFLACILVINSCDNVDTFGTLEQNLNQVQNTVSGKLPKWFNPNILKYYVIVHDNIEGSLTDAAKSYETIKTKYETQNCFLLKVNSRSPVAVNNDHLPDPWSQFIDNNTFKESSTTLELESPKEPPQEIAKEAEEKTGILSNHPLSPANDTLLADNLLLEEFFSKESGRPKAHGLCLSTDDVEQVKMLIYEFTKTCLIPYIEKQISLLNEQVSNKKGVSKSLFSATKRWFSTNKPGLSTSTVNNLIYSADSQELQVRKLGDLYFMFGHYSAAFNAYHMAKRDYNADQAWLYYAGALEMAALSAFMANETIRKTFDYMEESITIYLSTCKMPQFATRATVLSLECLKHHNMYGEAAHQLIRMTSEDSDLRSALLLEQAAYCFLQSKMVRKYAFHMVLAGHRFSKASQRKHSLRCYKQAFQVYEYTRWDLACDHIHYTIGKQANNLQLFEEAVESFSRLLKGESKQAATQQALFLKEYLMILGNKRDSENGQNQVLMPVLPVPGFEIDSLKILVGPTRPLATPGKIPAVGVNFNNADDPVAENKWLKLEEMLVQEIEGSQSVLFKPMISLYNMSKLEKSIPIAIINESVQIYVKLTNTLQTSLHLKNIYLLWSFSNDKETISNEFLDDKNDEFVKTYITNLITIDGNSKQDLILSITPLAIGTITITGICYTLTICSSTEISYLKGKQPIKIPSSSKQGNVEQKNVKIEVVPPAPCLQATFSEISMDFLSDELQRISVNLQNISSISLTNIYMATSVPRLLSSCEFKKAEEEILNWGELNTPIMKEKFVRKTHTTPVPLLGRVLEPGQVTTVDLWMKAPSQKGPVTIDLLIYYENILKTNIPKYRLIRHTWNLTVQESVSVDISTQASHNTKTVEELALAMKITNLNKIHSSIMTEVTLLSVGLLSKSWTLTKDIVTPKYINLHTQESAHILLKAKRSIKSTSDYSVIPLHSDRNFVNNLKNTYVTLAKSYEKPSLNIFKENLETFVFKENLDGILLFLWQALVVDGNKSKTVTGQCYRPVEIRRFNEDMLDMEKLLSDPVIDINENSDATNDNNEAAENQVSYNIICPPVLRHNFNKETLCIVPVKLLLHSTVDDGSLSVSVNTVELSPKISTSDPTPCSTHGSSSFCWLGNGRIVKILQPLSSTSVHLLVALTGPGTFNLGAHIEVLCKKVNQKEQYVLQTCKIHAAVIVINKEK